MFGGMFGGEAPKKKPARADYEGAFTLGGTTPQKIEQSHVDAAGSPEAAIEGYKFGDDYKKDTIFEFEGKLYTFDPATKKAQEVTKH